MESQQLQTLCPRVRHNVYLNIFPGNENINGIAHNFKHCVLEFDFYNIYLNILPGIKKKKINNMQVCQIQQILTPFFLKSRIYVAYFIGLQLATKSVIIELSNQLQ